MSSAAGMRRRQRDRPASGGPDQRDRGDAHRGAPAPAPRQPPGGEYQREDERASSSAHGQEKDIQTTRPVLATVSTAPAASSASASAMNAPASGSGCLLTVSRRLIDEAIPLSSLAFDAGW